MTPSKKLFIASTLLAVGYGLATLFGAPPPRQMFEAALPVAQPASSTVAAAPGANSPSAGPNRVGSVRLLPDAVAATPVRPGVADSSMPPALESRPLASAPTDTSVPAKFAAEPSMPLLESRLELRAALKDETPRALPEMARPSPQNPPGEVEAIASASPPAAPDESAANHVWPAGYTTAGPVPSSSPTMPAPAEPPLAAPRAATQFGPPPWPTGDVRPPRTHVVIDGDSLAKLAGRYLDDPRRSDELFALNRAVLSDPELLPIGVELKIPNAGQPRADYGDLLTSTASGELSVHAATNRGLVPVRPIPAAPTGSPRAELLRPLPAE